ncbi:MAG: hypothetical protein QOE89_2242 [Pseudonocardiales bacterium]|nr:hypothetical protein [Pseudonocardiales bacterium]
MTGVASMLSGPRFLEVGDTFGALNLYSKEPTLFHSDDAAALRVFGYSISAISAIATSRATAQDDSQRLRLALDSNRTIGVAMGILMNKPADQPGRGLRRQTASPGSRAALENGRGGAVWTWSWTRSAGSVP